MECIIGVNLNCFFVNPEGNPQGPDYPAFTPGEDSPGESMTKVQGKRDTCKQ